MADAGYIFGGDTGLSYEEVRRRRAIADQLASRMGGAPQNVGEGLSFLGAAIGSRIANKRAEKADEVIRRQEMDLLNSFFGGGGSSGGGASIYGGRGSSGGGSSYVAPAEVSDPNPGLGVVDQFGMEGDAELDFAQPQADPMIDVAGGAQDFMLPQQFEPLPINGALNGVDPSLAEMAAQAWGYAVPGGSINVTTGVSSHSPINHAPGHAIDFQVTRPDGSVVRASDPEMLQAAQIGRAMGVHGIGYGEGPTGNYMGGVHTHWDISRNGPRTWGDDDGGTSDRYGAGSAEHAAAIAAASGRPVEEVLAQLGIEPGDPERLSFGPTAERDFMLAELSPQAGASSPRATVPAPEQFASMADMEAQRVGVDPNLFRALVTQESAWRPDAVSPVGAFGLTQAMPATARNPGFGVAPLTNPNDPNEQLRFGADYLSAMLERYDGDVPRALAAYNWGPGNADNWNGDLAALPEETRNYVQRITGMAGGLETTASARNPDIAAVDAGRPPVAASAPVRMADAGAASGVATDAQDPRARLAQIVPLLQSPRPGVRAIAQVLVQREMQQMFPEPVDPMDALDLEYRQLQIEQMRQQMGGGEAPQILSPDQAQSMNLSPARVWAMTPDGPEDLGPSNYQEPAPTTGFGGLPMGPMRSETRDALIAQGVPLDPNTAYEVRNDRIEVIGGGPLVENNVGGTNFGQDYFEDRYGELQTQAASASQMLGMYDIAEQALASGLRTGFGAEAEQSLRRIGQAMGMDVDTDALAGGELLTSVTNRMALQMRNPDSGMGMPGAVSDRDLTFLKDAQIGIDRSPIGNARMLRAFRALEERKVELARMADQYIMQNGRLDIGFNEMVREYAETNPLFSQDMFADIQAPTTGAPADTPPPADAVSGMPDWNTLPERTRQILLRDLTPEQLQAYPGYSQ